MSPRIKPVAMLPTLCTLGKFDLEGFELFCPDIAGDLRVDLQHAFARNATSAQLVDVDPEQALRGAGLSKAKAAAIRDLAAKSTDGSLRLRSLGRLDDEEVIERLTQVRGIGVWSAQMFLMFRLGRLDVMPCGDLGIQEGLRRRPCSRRGSRRGRSCRLR